MSVVSFNETADRLFENAGPAKGEERKGFLIVLERLCKCDGENKSGLLSWGTKNVLK
jgi:hypothetical protein